MKKLIVVSLLIIALPFMASVNNNNQSAAYAGHVLMGKYCDGDCVNGRCSGCGAACSDGQRTDLHKDGGAQVPPGATDALEPGFLLFVLAFFMVMRLRS